MYDVSKLLLHDADGVIVCNKPPGLPSTGRSLDDPDCLQHLLTVYCRRMVWAAHQLDADTSGLNVFVRRSSLVAPWQNRLRWPNARKQYIAAVHGAVSLDMRAIDAPLGPLDATARQLGVTQHGKPAFTELEVLDRNDRFSLLRVTLRTGRTHQIRIHLAHVGHPIVGEQWYRRPPCTLHARQALHAWRLDFDDALEPQGISAPVPDDLRALFGSLNLQLAP